MTLPGIKDLKKLIDKELSEIIKIPFSQSEFDTLITNNLQDYCNLDHLGILFWVSETESGFNLCNSMMLLVFVSCKTPSDNKTEYSFIGFWDFGICYPLELLLPKCLSFRNSNENTDD